MRTSVTTKKRPQEDAAKKKTQETSHVKKIGSQGLSRAEVRQIVIEMIG